MSDSYVILGNFVTLWEASRASRSKRTSICGSCCATSSETRYGLDWCRAPSSGRGPAWLPSLLGRPNRCSIPARPRADLTGSRPSMPRCLRPTCRLFVNASSATRRSAPSRGFCRLHPLWDFSPPSDNAATLTWDDERRLVLEKRTLPMFSSSL